MKIVIITFFFLSLASYALEHSGSSTGSSPRSPRSPRQELQIVGNVERTQEFDKKNRVIRESYKAFLASKSVITVETLYNKKKEQSYAGSWKREQKPERIMDGECAHSYFEKLKRAYLQNEQ